MIPARSAHDGVEPLAESVRDHEGGGSVLEGACGVPRLVLQHKAVKFQAVTQPLGLPEGRPALSQADWLIDWRHDRAIPPESQGALESNRPHVSGVKRVFEKTPACRALASNLCLREMGFAQVAL